MTRSVTCRISAVRVDALYSRKGYIVDEVSSDSSIAWCVQSATDGSDSGVHAVWGEGDEGCGRGRALFTPV